MPRNDLKQLVKDVERMMKLMMNDPLLRPRNADIGQPRRIIRSVPKPEPVKAPEQPVKEPEKVPA